MSDPVAADVYRTMNAGFVQEMYEQYLRDPASVALDHGREPCESRIDDCLPVLGVQALGSDIRTAIARAYEAVDHIRFDGMQLRRDIGRRALGRS